MNIKTFAISIAITIINVSSPSSSGGLQGDSLKAPTFLLDAIEQVESNGDPNAIGDNGKAVGSFQIWKTYVDDVNRILREHRYNYNDRYDPLLSRYMVKTYIGHYVTKKRLKRNPTFEDMARIHNGGPNGYKKKCTEKYWEKIKKELTK